MFSSSPAPGPSPGSQSGSPPRRRSRPAPRATPCPRCAAGAQHGAQRGTQCEAQHGGWVRAPQRACSLALAAHYLPAQLGAEVGRASTARVLGDRALHHMGGLCQQPLLRTCLVPRAPVTGEEQGSPEAPAPGRIAQRLLELAHLGLVNQGQATAAGAAAARSPAEHALLVGGDGGGGEGGSAGQRRGRDHHVAIRQHQHPAPHRARGSLHLHACRRGVAHWTFAAARRRQRRQPPRRSGTALLPTAL